MIASLAGGPAGEPEAEEAAGGGAEAAGVGGPGAGRHGEPLSEPQGGARVQDQRE